jgi:hypothetical protein
MNRIRPMGWIPDAPDHRDLLYGLSNQPPAGPLPASVDLSGGFGAAYDQQHSPSCVAQSIVAMLDFLGQRLDDALPTGSRAFAYWNARAADGLAGSDGGSTIRSTLKAINRLGLCAESEWAYTPDHIRLQPTAACYADAAGYPNVAYLRLACNLQQLRQSLADGFPFTIGLTAYDNFPFDTDTGYVPMPRPDSRVIGQHCVVAAGYDDDSRQFLIRNSYGTGWGQDGYGALPYEYVTGYCSDQGLWSLRRLLADAGNSGDAMSGSADAIRPGE